MENEDVLIMINTERRRMRCFSNHINSQLSGRGYLVIYRILNRISCPSLANVNGDGNCVGEAAATEPDV